MALQFMGTSEKSRDASAWWPAMLSVIAAVHSSLTVGYAYGYTSTALEQLSELPDGYAFRLGSISADLFAMSVPAGGLLFSLLSGVLTDRIGRKKTLLLTGIPNAVGWILIAISPYIKDGGPSVFKVIILTGRLLNGVAASGIFAAGPVYAAEMALPKQRGSISTVFMLCMLIGVLMTYGVGAISVLSYNQSAVIATGLVFVYIIFVAITPESPRWLVIKGHDARALKALTFLRQSCELAKKELGEIKKIAESTPKFTLKQQLHELRKKHVYMPLVIIVCLTVVHVLCGQYVLEFYSSIVLEEAGVDNPEATSTYSIAAAQFCGIVISALLVDRVGRKPLLILGGCGAGIGATLLGTHFYITQPSFCQTEKEELQLNASTTLTKLNTTMNNETGEYTTEACNPQFAPLAICSMILFSISASIGYRCMHVTMKAEIFPLSVRGLCTGLMDCSGWMLLAVTVGSFYSYEQAVGPYSAWWSFAAIDFGGVLFVLGFVPETKGKSLEDIETIYRSKKTARILLKAFKVKGGANECTPV